MKTLKNNIEKYVVIIKNLSKIKPVMQNKTKREFLYQNHVYT